MITFTCPHCNNPFEVDDSLAGRDGWCRVCKRIIVIPGDNAPGWNDLSVEEQCDRLDRMLQFAASKADKYKRLILKVQQENARLERRAAAINHGEIAQPAEYSEPSNGGGDIRTPAEWEAEVNRLTSALERERTARDAANRLATEKSSQLEEVRKQLAEAAARLLEHEETPGHSPDDASGVPEGSRWKLHDALTERSSEVERLRVELAELSAQLEDTEDERESSIRNIEEEIARYRSDAQSLQEQLQEAFESLDRSEESRATLAAQLDCLQDEYEALQKRLAEIGGEDETAEPSLADTPDEYDAAEDIEVLKLEIERLSADLECERRDREALREALTAQAAVQIDDVAVAAHESLRNKQQELEEARRREDELLTRVEALEHELEQVQAQARQSEYVSAATPRDDISEADLDEIEPNPEEAQDQPQLRDEEELDDLIRVYGDTDGEIMGAQERGPLADSLLRFMSSSTSSRFRK